MRSSRPFLLSLTALLVVTTLASAQYPGVEPGSFDSLANGRTIPFNIYLPPNYQQSKDRYPVVYWFHGALQDQNAGLRVTTFLHSAIVAGELPPMVLVLGTDGFRATTGYKDWPERNQFGEQAVLELIAHVDANYRTIPNRAARAIEGFSLGGLATMYFAARHPDLFCSALTTGGALADWETYVYVYIYAEWLRKNTSFKLCIGSNDFLARQQNGWFSEFLTYLNIPHDFQIVTGAGHSIQTYYDRLGASTMTFHAAQFFGP